MKRFNIADINTPGYWDKSQTAIDFGLRQQKYLELAGEGYSIGELGCGKSPFLDHARSKFIECWGIDFSRETISSNRKEFPKVNFVTASAIDTPFRDGFFDVTVAGEVIEHLQVPQQLIEEMVRITKHRIIISTPKLEFEDPEHLWEFSEEDLQAMLSPYGETTTETIRSMRFPGRSYIFAKCEL
jgi:ubiquinone/menaquinone biosynthesis C-methylase UbiE